MIPGLVAAFNPEITPGAETIGQAGGGRKPFRETAVGGFLSGLFGGGSPQVPQVIDVEEERADYTAVYVLTAAFIAALFLVFYKPGK